LDRIREPYIKAYTAIKEDWKDLLLVAVFHLAASYLVTLIALPFIYSLAFSTVGAYLLMIFGSAILPYLVEEFGVYFFLIIFFILIYLIVILVLIFCVAIAVGSLHMGLNLFATKKTNDVLNGKKLELTPMLEEFRESFLDLFRKGFLLYVFYFILTFLMVMAIFALFFWTLILPYLFILIVMGISILLSPVLQFVLDMTILNMVFGSRFFDSLGNSFRSLFRKEFLYYYIPVFLATFILTFSAYFLGPLSYVLQYIFFIGLKVFLIRNYELMSAPQNA